MNYYQFHISDWALHTSHLTLEEEGVYRRLLDFYYDTEKPIPTETQPVIRRLRLGSHSETVALILSEFFHLEVDGWHNNRADIEISNYQANAERARENGKKGGRPKKENQINSAPKTQPVIYGNPEETTLKANHKPRTINQEPLTKNHNKNIAPQAADSDSVSETFSHWKTIMNHPKAKLDDKRRRKIRDALKLGYTPSDLIAAIDGCAKSPYHMGADGNNTTVYDDLELILRDAKHIDQFLKINLSPASPAGGGHATNKFSYGASAGNSKASPSDLIRAQARNALERIDRKNGDTRIHSHG